MIVIAHYSETGYLIYVKTHINYTHKEVLYHDNSEFENSRSNGYNSSLAKKNDLLPSLAHFKTIAGLTRPNKQEPAIKKARLVVLRLYNGVEIDESFHLTLH
jgi:hypothetical protein